MKLDTAVRLPKAELGPIAQRSDESADRKAGVEQPCSVDCEAAGSFSSFVPYWSKLTKKLVFTASVECRSIEMC